MSLKKRKLNKFKLPKTNFARLKKHKFKLLINKKLKNIK